MNFLWVDHRVITPDYDGGSLRAWNILKIIRSFGHKVYFASLFPDSFEPFQSALPQDEKRLVDAGIELLRSLPEKADFDSIVLSSPSVGLKFMQFCRTRYPRAQLIYDTVDLHHVRYFREARVQNNAPHALRSLRMKELERNLCQNADQVWVVSEKERRVVSREFQLELNRVVVIPNTHDVQRDVASFESREGLVFVGSFLHPPNADAITHFARETFPALRKSLDGLSLHVVGANPPPEVSALQSESVKVHGFIQDLTGFLSARRLNIAPLRAGAGIKGKILYALGCGLPTVCSEIGAEGIAETTSHGMTIATDRESWVREIGQVYGERSLWDRQSSDGRKFILSNYSTDAVSAKISATLGIA